MPSGFGCWNTTSRGRKARRYDLWHPQEMWAGVKKDCYSTRDKAGGLDLEGRRDWRGSSVILRISLFCLADVFPVNACWCWRLE